MNIYLEALSAMGPATRIEARTLLSTPVRLGNLSGTWQRKHSLHKCIKPIEVLTFPTDMNLRKR